MFNNLILKIMKKYLVLYHYQDTIQVSKLQFPQSWSNDSCISYIKNKYPNLITFEPYDTFVICL